jgi:hypothetical protein
MRPLLLALPVLLAGCADAGGIAYQGRPIVLPSFSSMNDAAYSAGARAGERLGTAPPAYTPRAGEWYPDRADAGPRRDGGDRPWWR